MEIVMERISLRIGGMSCGGCVINVRKALAAIPGVEVQQVRVGSATVAYDPAVVEPGAIQRALVQAGYQSLRPGRTAAVSPVTSP
jgi:copper chaperone